MKAGMLDGIWTRVGYRTGSGNTMTIEVSGHCIPREDMPLVELADYKQLCEGCKGLNGGCANWAPYFEWIKPSQKFFYVIDVKLDMAWAIKYAHRMGDNVIKHNYFRCCYADLLTDKYTWFLVKTMAQASGNYALGIGHCHGCRSKKMCTVLQGDKCINPEGRTYSVEATGVECSQLNLMLYGERLPWWFKGSALPWYMRRFAGLFTNDNLDAHLMDAVKAHRSFISVEQVVPMPQYDMEMIEAPETSLQDAGTVFPMYVDFTDGLVAQED